MTFQLLFRIRRARLEGISLIALELNYLGRARHLVSVQVEPFQPRVGAPNAIHLPPTRPPKDEVSASIRDEHLV